MPHSHERHACTELRLLTFGGLSLVDSTGAVVGQQRRRLALLALLSASRERGLSRDRLVSFLSPESATESARIALGLMQSLAAAGDTAGALRHARVHAAFERAELGNGPDPEVAGFAARLQAVESSAPPVEWRPHAAEAAEPSRAGNLPADDH